MRNRRKHKRFKLHLPGLSSKMSLVGRVKLIDMSLGGVAIKADRKVNIGKECLMMLGYEGKHIHVKGIVTRSALSEIEEKADGETVTVYSVGIFFKDESAGMVEEFLDSIGNNMKTQVPEQADWLYSDILFRITTANEKVLNLPTQFGVKDISQKGIIIQTDLQLKIDSVVLLELSIGTCDPVSFVGKVVSCRVPQDKTPLNYNIGVEFSELTERDKSLLKRFIDCVKECDK
jgi:hypothetical protein